MKNRALTKLLKATVAVLALTFIIVAFSTVAGATDAVVEESTKVINMDYYRTYTFYPDGYKVDDGEITPFVGTYILTGHPCEDVAFKSYDEPVTYNVIFHNLNAMATSWYGMLGVDRDVTLNVTVYGENYAFGHNHPGISVGTKNEGASPLVNITMLPDSSNSRKRRAPLRSHRS